MNGKSESIEELDELDVEQEIDEAPLVEFEISVVPADPTLELLTQQIEREDIIIPFYQRRYVWKIEQASKLIESFLMGLPVPQVFLYVNEDDQLEVIDGQQRLMSVHYFLSGYFGEEDSQGKKPVFRLKGLSERSEYNGKLFSELTPRDQRKLRNSTLRAIKIQQLKPTKENESVFHIFERLNTGGTQLKPQEIRNAVYRGKIVDSLKKLNSIPEWQSILGLKKPDKNQKDVELILRLFSLFEVWQDYQKPLLKWLNTAMAENRDFSSERTKRFDSRFRHAVALVSKSLTKPFRPKGVVNSGVLEAVFIAVMEDNISAEKLGKNYPNLFKNETFMGTITGSTADQATLIMRVKTAKEILGA